MGRQPDTSMPADADNQIAEGHLSPEVWARLVLARVNKRDTGTLVVSREGCSRTFRFLGGVPIVATSTQPDEDFTSTMVACGLLDQPKLDWIRKHTGAHESEIEGLIGAGTVQRTDVDAHHNTHIQHLIAATLAWPDGEFSWQPAPELGDKVERSLLPAIQTIEGLIGGILGGFELTALETFVDAADAGDLLPDARLTGMTPPAWVPEDMGQLHTHLGQALGRTEIAESLGLSVDRVAAMLWLLEATGWAKRAHPPAALIPLGTVAVIQAGTTPTPAAPDQAAPKQAAPKQAAPKQAAPKQAAPKQAAPKQATPKQAAPKQAAPKQATPKQAAPINKKTIEAPRKPVIDPEKGLSKALKSIADEDFDQAYRLLSDVRKEKPSCPETLAALGWSAWRTGNLGTNAYDGPEDFLLLALTFDANHPKALEYYARIAIEKGETDNARNRLLQLLKAAPESPWAEEALDTLNPKGRKSGIRLWPKS
jgi:hypothetical protein